MAAASGCGEDGTPAHLGGVASQASRFELAVFQGAVLEFMLDAEVPMSTAIGVIYDAGNWREVVAERCWLQWTLAQRRTAEERQQP